MNAAVDVRRFSAPALEVPRSRAEVESEAARRYAAAEVAGHAAGYADGLAAGQRAADAARAEYQAAATGLRSAAAALEAAAAALADADRTALVDVERAVVRLAVEVAEALIGHELPDGVARATDTLRRAAPLVADRGSPIIRAHPSVVTELVDQLDELDGVWHAADFRADPALEPGECAVEVGACQIDAQIHTAIDTLRRIAGGEPTDGTAPTCLHVS